MASGWNKNLLYVESCIVNIDNTLKLINKVNILISIIGWTIKITLLEKIKVMTVKLVNIM